MANPIGEDSWLAYVEEAAKNSTDLESCVNVVELYKRAADAEPTSLKVWLAYCSYFWSLWKGTQDNEFKWPEEEQMLGQEVFSFDTALDLWQQGYEAIKYRLNDSQLFWDHWISLEREQLDKTKTPEGIQRITQLYRDRLTTPHLAWDETSQAFSSFLSEYDRAAWEDAMKDVTAKAQGTKKIIEERDSFELKLKQAERNNDTDLQKSILLEYLDWEFMQNRRNTDDPTLAMNLLRGLFSRALTGIFATDEEVWYDFVTCLSGAIHQPESAEQLLDTLRRAIQHCPWSGRLWNRYILCAEEAGLEFSEIETIKHAATSENELYRDGMESMIKMYEAWCSFLKRTAMQPRSADEATDVADVGLRAALEDVAVVGKRLYGKDFQGDPRFRLERIYIQYLTDKKGAIDQARKLWDKLARGKTYADNHDFWSRYYMWEMLVFSSNSQDGGNQTPTHATAVLKRAANRRTIDWPEKVLEMYLQHCSDYEVPSGIRSALDMVYRAEKGIQKRREREEKEKAAAYAAYYGTVEAQAPASAAVGVSPGGQKRKLDTSEESNDGEAATSKRQKAAQEAPSPSNGNAQQDLKRDRENSTIIVSNLPYDVAQNKIRQYFKDYGHIKNITALVKEDDGASSTALIEFSSAQEAQSALLRDMKYFEQSQIRVTSGYDLTVYVTNFPPTADEKYLRELFEDCGDLLSIRWPSLKVNSHRRFCYISFRDRTASAKAVKKDGLLLEDKFKLVAKYSDPGSKKNREGAVAEGREIHISNIDSKATEDEVRDVFSKYGTVKRVNLPRNMAGKNRGFGFVDFETKEQAEKAVAELHNTKFRSQIIQVEVSKVSKIKHSATTTTTTTTNDQEGRRPSRDAEGDSTMSGDTPKPSVEEINSRTISLMGLPDTVNDARVRAIAEPFGEIVKLVLQPSHGGATIEFIDAATAGKAALQLNTTEYEGHKLRTGSADELRSAKPTRPDGRASTDSKPKSGFMPPPAAVRRPALGAKGAKRGLGFVPRAPTVQKKAAAGVADSGEGVSKPKSNADFKAMFLSSGKARDSAKEDKNE